MRTVPLPSEYGLIAALIAIAVIVSAGGLGDVLSNSFNKIHTEVRDA